MAKAAESKEESLEELTDGKLEEIEKPNIFLKHWKKKDTPYGNDYTTNFAQAPDSPRYPDEDKGYKSETFVGGKKRVANSNTRKAKKFTKEDSQAIKEHYENEFKRQRVDDEDAAASYYGDVAQPKVGTRHNNPDTPAGKFFRKQPKEVIQHQEHTTYDPDLAEKWKGRFDPKPETKLSEIKDTDSFEDKQRKLHEVAVHHDDYLGQAHAAGMLPKKPDPSAHEDMNDPADGAGIRHLRGDQRRVQELLRGKAIFDLHKQYFSGKNEKPAEKGLTINGDARQAAKKSYHSNCPYCNEPSQKGKGMSKQHDSNPDKFHAWMDSERQKSMLTNTRFMNKIESADPSTVQQQPKRRKPHLDTGKSPFKTPRSKIDEARASDTHNAMPKGQEKIPFKVLTGTAGKPDLINAKDRDDIEPSRTLYGNQKSTPIKTPDKTDAPAKDFIAPSTNPKNLPAMYKDPSGKTPDTGDAPNLKPSKGKLGFLKDKNPFKGGNKKPKEQEGYLIDAGNIGAKVGGDNPNRSVGRLRQGVAAQDISNKSSYSLRTKDGYGSGDLSLQNVTPNTVVNDKETYIGQTATGKHRMIDRNKITNTRVGDDIHYYVNGIEDRGIVVKMGNEYIQVFKEDGYFHDVHINDTFFVKDIVVNKEWNKMDATERYDALTEIHAPSPRFIGKSWNELPIEIKELLTKKGAGSKIPAEAGRMGAGSAELPPAAPKINDENTKHYGTDGTYYGTGKKGKLALDAANDPTGFTPSSGFGKSEDFRKLKPSYQGDAEEKEKSDVEEGTYGNIGSTSNVAPSTSTNLDVSESTGYEERPHISVEEVGSLPRRDAKDNGDDETKEKEDDIKEPKESKDTKKVGVPTANYNTFGITYAVKANTVWNKKTQRWEQKDG